MNKKVAIIFFTCFIATIVSACCDNETFNIKTTEIEFIIEDNYISKDENLEFRLNTVDEIVSTDIYWNLSLVQSAYAQYDCDQEDTYRPIETVKDFKIKVLTDFSDEYKSNDDITELIDVRFFNWRSQKIETRTLLEFFNFLSQDERATGRSAELQDATYIISTKPTLSSKQKFELEFLFTNNSVMLTTTGILTWE